jgi:UDP-GlcNAc:undecaprenyl-phosphate GlcNAc-1-phosphate transferase
LWYNRPPARIYLGDGGSYLIGTWLAILAVAAWHSPGHGRPWTPAVLFVAVPILELLVAVVRRLRAGRHPFGGDRDHIYDQLVAKGRTPAGTVVAVVAAQAILVAGGLAVARLAGALPAAAVTATVIVCLLALLARAGFFAPPPLRRTP